MSTKTTGTKYLHIDYRSRFGNDYVVRVKIAGKTFIVWRGNDEEKGKQVANEVEWKMAEGEASFLEWYDYDRFDFFESIGTNSGAGRDRWDYYIGKRYGPYEILEVIPGHSTLRESKVKVACTNCGLVKIMDYKTITNYNNLNVKHCKECREMPVYKGRKPKIEYKFFENWGEDGGWDGL